MRFGEIDPSFDNEYRNRFGSPEIYSGLTTNLLVLLGFKFPFSFPVK